MVCWVSKTELVLIAALIQSTVLSARIPLDPLHVAAVAAQTSIRHIFIRELFTSVLQKGVGDCFRLVDGATTSRIFFEQARAATNGRFPGFASEGKRKTCAVNRKSVTQTRLSVF